MISRRIIKENAKAQLGNNIFGNLWRLIDNPDILDPLKFLRER